ncbi:MAG: M20/M25/M40 family metallo-hydrolase, partial [Terracidiphilus sp.]
VLNNIRSRLLTLETIRPWQKNADDYSSACANAAFVLMERKFASLRAADTRCSLAVRGGIRRPPMVRTPGTVRLYREARARASELGFQLEEAASGGGSDGNFTSALGIPTLDGMGAVGEGAHARHESIFVEHLSPRTALLAGLLAE